MIILRLLQIIPAAKRHCILHLTTSVMPLFPTWLCVVILAFASWSQGAHGQNAADEQAVRGFFSAQSGSVSSHTSNWAVLVCASRYWFNYRVCGVAPVKYIDANGAHSICRMHLACMPQSPQLGLLADHTVGTVQ